MLQPSAPSAVAKPLTWAGRQGSAWFAIVINAVLPSLLMLWRYAFLNAHREDVGRIPGPVDNRPDESTAPAPT